MMRVAYVCLDPGVPVFGRKGSSVHCQEIIRVLRQRGCEVDLFARRLGDDVPADLADVRVHRLGGKLEQGPAQREKALASLNPIVLQRLEAAGPFDMVYERYSLWNFAAMQFAHEQRIPGILEVNSPLIREQKTWRCLIDESTAKSMQASCFKNATSIIAVSDQVAEDLHSNWFARHKTTVIPNGVNCTKFRSLEYQDTRTSGNMPITIGFIGTLKPWHGVSTLIDAFADVHSKNPMVRLKIVGDGPERDRLDARLDRFSIDVRDDVCWTGAVPNADVPGILASFDIAVAPYPDIQDFYFSPLKILEYMAAGLPVVASRIGQIPQLIEDEATGVLVKSGCGKELASSLLRLTRDREMRLKLGAAARRVVETQYTWQHVVDQIMATIPPHIQHCEAV